MPEPTYELSEDGKKLIKTCTPDPMVEEINVKDLQDRKAQIDARIVQLQAESDSLAAEITTAEGLGYTEE